MHKFKMVVIGVMVFFAMGLAGCVGADKFLGSTTASYTPGGQLYYQSNKNQEGFKAKTTFDPKTGNLTGLDIETKATTPEAAMVAAFESNKAMMESLSKVLDALMSMKPPVVP